MYIYIIYIYSQEMHPGVQQSRHVTHMYPQGCVCVYIYFCINIYIYIYHINMYYYVYITIYNSM